MLNQQDCRHNEQVSSSSLTSSHYQNGAIEGNPPGTGAKNLLQRPSKSPFLPSRSPSISCCHHFIHCLSAAFNERLGKWLCGGEGGVHLTLICSIVSFTEMTSNFRGKRVIVFFLSFERQFAATGDFVVKAVNYFRFDTLF